MITSRINQSNYDRDLPSDREGEDDREERRQDWLDQYDNRKDRELDNDD